MTATAYIRRLAAIILFAACLASWAGLGLAVWLDMARHIQLAAVFAAAISTEVAIWGGAMLLGWTALANRSLILRRFMGRKD